MIWLLLILPAIAAGPIVKGEKPKFVPDWKICAATSCKEGTVCVIRRGDDYCGAVCVKAGDITCTNVDCFEGQTCIHEEVTCVMAPCYPVPKCVPIGDEDTYSVDPNQPCQPRAPCPDGEYYDECGGCEGDCETGQVECKGKCNPSEAKCRCESPLVRGPDGTCISEKMCPINPGSYKITSPKDKDYGKEKPTHETKPGKPKPPHPGAQEPSGEISIPPSGPKPPSPDGISNPPGGKKQKPLTPGIPPPPDSLTIPLPGPKPKPPTPGAPPPDTIIIPPAGPEESTDAHLFKECKDLECDQKYQECFLPIDNGPLVCKMKPRGVICDCPRTALCLLQEVICVKGPCPPIAACLQAPGEGKPPVYKPEPHENEAPVIPPAKPPGSPGESEPHPPGSEAPNDKPLWKQCVDLKCYKNEKVCFKPLSGGSLKCVPPPEGFKCGCPLPSLCIMNEVECVAAPCPPIGECLVPPDGETLPSYGPSPPPYKPPPPPYKPTPPPPYKPSPPTGTETPTEPEGPSANAAWDECAALKCYKTNAVCYKPLGQPQHCIPPPGGINCLCILPSLCLIKEVACPAAPCPPIGVCLKPPEGAVLPTYGSTPPPYKPTPPPYKPTGPPGYATPKCPLPCSPPSHVCVFSDGVPQCVEVPPPQDCTPPCPVGQTCEIRFSGNICIPNEPVGPGAPPGPSTTEPPLQCSDNEEISECGNLCENKCASLCEPQACPFVCGPPACACKPDFYRVEETGKCEKPQDCPPCPGPTGATSAPGQCVPPLPPCPANCKCVRHPDGTQGCDDCTCEPCPPGTHCVGQDCVPNVPPVYKPSPPPYTPTPPPVYTPNPPPPSQKCLPPLPPCVVGKFCKRNPDGSQSCVPCPLPCTPPYSICNFEENGPECIIRPGNVCNLDCVKGKHCVITVTGPACVNDAPQVCNLLCVIGKHCIVTPSGPKCVDDDTEGPPPTPNPSGPNVCLPPVPVCSANCKCVRHPDGTQGCDDCTCEPCPPGTHCVGRDCVPLVPPGIDSSTYFTNEDLVYKPSPPPYNPKPPVYTPTSPKVCTLLCVIGKHCVVTPSGPKCVGDDENDEEKPKPYAVKPPVYGPSQKCLPPLPPCAFGLFCKRNPDGSQACVPCPLPCTPPYSICNFGDKGPECIIRPGNACNLDCVDGKHCVITIKGPVCVNDGVQICNDICIAGRHCEVTPLGNQCVDDDEGPAPAPGPGACSPPCSAYCKCIHNPDGTNTCGDCTCEPCPPGTHCVGQDCVPNVPPVYKPSPPPYTPKPPVYTPSPVACNLDCIKGKHCVVTPSGPKCVDDVPQACNLDCVKGKHCVVTPTGPQCVDNGIQACILFCVKGKHCVVTPSGPKCVDDEKACTLYCPPGQSCQVGDNGQQFCEGPPPVTLNPTECIAPFPQCPSANCQCVRKPDGSQGCQCTCEPPCPPGSTCRGTTCVPLVNPTVCIDPFPPCPANCVCTRHPDGTQTCGDCTCEPCPPGTHCVGNDCVPDVAPPVYKPSPPPPYSPKPKGCEPPCPPHTKCSNGNCVPDEGSSPVKPYVPPPKCGENEVIDKCGKRCESTCYYVCNPPQICPDICLKPDCVCAERYFRNKDGKCVLKDKCLPECKPTKPPYVPTTTPPKITCANVRCGFETHCVETPTGPECVPISPPELTCANVLCVPGTHCIDTSTGPHCVPDTCGQNEELNECGNHCEDVCANKCQPVICTQDCKPPACACKKGFFRDEKTGQCVGCKQCYVFPPTPTPYKTSTPPTLTCANVLCIVGTTCIETPTGPQCVPIKCGENEELNKCGNHCEGKCSDKCQLLPCTDDCRPPACACKKDFFRDAKGKCVICKECGKHESINKCGNLCEGKCLHAPNPTPCPKICKPPACACDKDYFRDYSGNCVKLDKCPAPPGAKNTGGKSHDVGKKPGNNGPPGQNPCSVLKCDKPSTCQIVDGEARCVTPMISSNPYV